MHVSPILNANGEVEKAGCVVINSQNQILLVTNADRSAWGLPKGHAEAGETPVQVALRETREETGYDVEVIRPVGDMTYVNVKTNMPIRVHYFLARPIRRHEEADEIWEWVDVKAALGLVKDNVKAFLIEILKP